MLIYKNIHKIRKAEIRMEPLLRRKRMKNSHTQLLKCKIYWEPGNEQWKHKRKYSKILRVHKTI